MAKTIFFQPASQHDNTGDVLINKILLDILKIYGNIIVDDKNKPLWFLDEIGITKDNTLSDKTTSPLLEMVEETLRKEKNTENIYLVFPPGHTSRKGRVAAIYGDHGFRRTQKLLGFKKQGLKMVRVGFSIGPFDLINAIAESYYSRIFKLYCLRDTESLKLAKRFLFKNAQLLPDLAWAYKPNVVKNSSSAYIVVSIRSNAFGTKHSDTYLQPILDALIQLFTNTVLKNYELRVVYQVEFDKEASHKIHKTLLDRNIRSVLIDKKLNLRDAEETYSNAKYILSNRLHVLMIGLTVNTLSIPLVIDNDNRKITSIFNDNGLSEFILDVRKPAMFSAKVTALEVNEQALRLMIAGVVEKNSRKVHETIGEAFR